MALTIVPASADRWPDIERLFGANGACAGCWCMFWRKPHSDFDRDKGARNRSQLQAVVERGEVPGILAYDGDEPVGWCAIAPRSVYTALERSRVLKPLDDTPVWSISCLFIAKTHRRRGVSVELLKASADFVRSRGGRIVEGYPIIPKKGKTPDAFAWHGTLSAFLSAGFHEMKRWSENRPIVRREA